MGIFLSWFSGLIKQAFLKGIADGLAELEMHDDEPGIDHGAAIRARMAALPPAPASNGTPARTRGK